MTILQLVQDTTLTNILLLVDELELANQKFRSLVILHIRITLLSDVFATTGHSQGRAAIGLLQTLMNNTPSHVLNDLGTLHRASIWENIALNLGLASKGIEVQQSGSSSPLEGSPNPAVTELPNMEAPISNGVTSHTNGRRSDGETIENLGTSEGNEKHDSPKELNASSLRHITQGLPNALSPFFQGIHLSSISVCDTTPNIDFKQWLKCSMLAEIPTLLKRNK